MDCHGHPRVPYRRQWTTMDLHRCPRMPTGANRRVIRSLLRAPVGARGCPQTNVDVHGCPSISTDGCSRMTAGAHGLPWMDVPTDDHGRPWTPTDVSARAHGFPRVSVGTRGHLWAPIGDGWRSGTSMDHHGCLRMQTDVHICLCLWIFTGIRGHPWASMDVDGCPRVLMNAHRLPWASTDVHRCPRAPMDFHGTYALPRGMCPIYGHPCLPVRSPMVVSMGVRGHYRRHVRGQPALPYPWVPVSMPKVVFTDVDGSPRACPQTGCP